MKAVVCDRYGAPDVLRIEEVERPAPGDGELLVRVRATTVNRLDCHTREANRSNGLVISGISRLVSGPRRPRRRILGSEFAGEVEAAGAAVTRFGAGDRVFGNTGRSSTGSIRSRTSSRRPATSKRSRRSATSSWLSATADAVLHVGSSAA